MAETHPLPFHYSSSAFPLLLLPPSHLPLYSLQSLLQSIVDHREQIECELQAAGALLFRGFPLNTASDFNAVMEAFGWEEHPYKGPALRKRVKGRVFTANECPLHQPINFHHEMSMHEDFPTKLAFFCEVAPPEGGETAIVSSHNITERMAEKYPELVSKLEKEGWYYSVSHSQEDDPDSYITGWQTYFGTDDKEEAQIKAEESEFKWRVKWKGNTMICETGLLVAIRAFDGNKKKAWFNYLTFGHANRHFMFGDGSIFPEEAIESLVEILKEECVEVKWEVGDLLLLDNRLVQHARRPSKPPRRVLVALCK